MLFRLVVLFLSIGLTVEVVLRVPMKRKESLNDKLIRQKRFHELRVLNRVRLTRLINPLISQFDVSRQPFYDYADQEFNTILSIGTPPQLFEVIPDTSESNTWVVDKTCNGSASYYDCPSICSSSKEWCSRFCEDYCCQSNSSVSSQTADYGNPCQGKTQFDSTASTTYQSTGTDFHIPVGLGNVSGIFGKDTFTFGDTQYGSVIEIPETTFGQANRLSVSFTGTLFNGVLGLGFPKMAFDGEVPVFQNGIDHGVFDEPIFTIWLDTKGRKAMDQPAGSLTLGGKDTDHCNANITFVPLISKTVWWFNVVGIAVNDKKTGGDVFVALSSIGTTLNLVPTVVMTDLVYQTDAIYSYEYGFYEVDCSIQFTWSIFLEQQIELKIDQSTALWNIGNDQCLLAFAALPDEGHGIDVIVGVPFFEQFCQIFDYGNGQIGFSKSN
ncbi:hypothetical protein M3Y94_01303100 [Aphelenchoides besseyi]|nr:hypothetical protein M3Y94_01303100 [Aphelenchoides besseyi]KAI6220199.1 Aspartic peptidase family and Aspartic peptidase domain-containing protein [Aphelenchoides besseyi]